MYTVKIITPQHLEGLRYCEESPTGLVDSEALPVGSVSASGYWEVKISGKIFKVHRLIYFLLNPDSDQSLDIDHLDGDKLNNLSSNLRLCTKRINSKNRKKNKNNPSGFKGISVRLIKKIKYMRCRVRIDGQLFEKYFNIDLEGGYEKCLEKALRQRNKFYTNEFTERHIND